MHTFDGFVLRHLSLPPGEEALVLLGPDYDVVAGFLSAYIEAAYPPGERGSSYLALSTSPRPRLTLEASGGGTVVQLVVEELSDDIAPLIERSIGSLGSVLILYGYQQDGQVILLQPLSNHSVKRQVLIDGRFVSSDMLHDWKPFLRIVAEEYPSVETDPS